MEVLEESLTLQMESDMGMIMKALITQNPYRHCHMFILKGFKSTPDLVMEKVSQDLRRLRVTTLVHQVPSVLALVTPIRMSTESVMG